MVNCLKNYNKSIDLLTSQGKFYINLGLERVQAVLALLKNPQNSLKFIHVAGTNGKGSVCAMLSAILKKSGLNVGLFTSPHVFEYTERIKINDIEIQKEDFAQETIDIVNLADENNIHLTEFEILTIVAFKYFAQNNVDIVVLETGLGGRLDATNIIENNICSVITNIDFDHTERLGRTIEEIAGEKAGIIKKNCPVVVSENNLGFDIIKKTAKEKNSVISNPCKIANFYEIALKGAYQKENLALVLTVIDILNNNGFKIPEEDIKNGLSKVIHPCRFEYIEDKNILIDGAHNPNGAKLLRQSLDESFPNQSFNFIFGCLNNKKYQQMMSYLFTPKDNVYFYEFGSENACKYDELASVCKQSSRPFSEFNHDKNTLTVICGSFYMIKELLQKMDIK